MKSELVLLSRFTVVKQGGLVFVNLHQFSIVTQRKAVTLGFLKLGAFCLAIRATDNTLNELQQQESTCYRKHEHTHHHKAHHSNPYLSSPLICSGSVCRGASRHRCQSFADVLYTSLGYVSIA